MDFPLNDLMDEQACSEFLVHLLHPDGLACPRCHHTDTLKVHRYDRAPILVYRCHQCRRIFNAFTTTVLHGTRRSARQWVLILRGFAQGVSTAQLARELECDRSELLKWRHRLQDLAFRAAECAALRDAVVEADELYQNAGEKRGSAPRPRRSAAASRQPVSWPRHVGERPSPGLRGRRPGERTGALARGSSRRSGDPGSPGRGGHCGGSLGQHRRMEKL
jgi:transposase-like protein